MKKLLSIFLAVILVFSVTACSSLIPSTKEASRGIVSGNTYTSDYSGLSLTVPTDWTFSSDEEIAEVAGIGADALGVDKFSQTLANNATVYDMMANNPATSESIMVIYENTKKTAGKQVGEEEYIDIISNQLSPMGYNLDSKETATLCGSTYVKCIFSVEIQGIKLTQAYFVRSMGDYMLSVIITSNGLTSLETMESYFN